MGSRRRGNGKLIQTALKLINDAPAASTSRETGVHVFDASAGEKGVFLPVPDGAESVYTLHYLDDAPNEEQRDGYTEQDVLLPSVVSGFTARKRYKVWEGGRGSAKSRSAATLLVLRAASRKTRVLCTRELQHSIAESVHKLISDTVSRLKLDSLFTVTNTHIRCVNGSEFIFSGIKNNVNKIKSMEDVDVCWCEEAESITETSWRILTPTIRAPGSEIWVVFNAYDTEDATYQRYVQPFDKELVATGRAETEQHLVQRMNYTENPWFPDELRVEMEDMKRDHYRDYLHVWMGQPVGASENAVIDPLWINAAVDAHVKLGFIARGVKSLGFDPADTGNDSKGLVGRHGSVVTLAKSWYEGDITEAISIAFATAQEMGATDLVYDAIGVGAAVKQHVALLQGRDKLMVEGFTGSNTPEQPDTRYRGDKAMRDVFRNRRAQAFWLLRDRFEKPYLAVEKGQYIDPEELISLSSDLESLNTLKSELSRVERKRGATNNSLIQLESKEEMKRRGMKSPGLADALMYAFSNPSVPDNFYTPLKYKNQGYA